MCRLSVLISQMFPRPWGCRTWRRLRPGGLELQCLSGQMFLIRQLSFRLSPCGSQYPAFPMFYTDTSIPPVSPTPWVSLQAIAHIALSLSSFPFSLLDDPSSLSSNSTSPVETAPGFPGLTFFMLGSSCTLHIMASVQCTSCFCMPDSVLLCV